MSPFPKTLALLSTCLMMASSAHPVQELTRQYKDTPHHAAISRFVSAMESTGNAYVKDTQGCTLLMYCPLELTEMHMVSIIPPPAAGRAFPGHPGCRCGRKPLLAGTGSRSFLSPALHDLALRLMWGIDGRQDETSAYKLLHHAAAAGHTPSADFLKENPPPAPP